jgi:molecular chaperone GrpE
MSHKRLIWQEISELAARLIQRNHLDPADIHDLGQQLGRLGKVQFKTNTLLEAQLEQQKETLTALQAALARQSEMLAAASLFQQKEIEAARHELLLALLPVVDGLDAALANGRRQLARLTAAGEAYQILLGWLEGLYLVRRRMMDVLTQAGIEPIPAVGRPFDPHLHVAAGVDTSGRAPNGIIVAEDRRGYRSPEGVLRYAEVIVSRPAAGVAAGPSQVSARPAGNTDEKNREASAQRATHSQVEAARSEVGGRLE